MMMMMSVNEESWHHKISDFGFIEMILSIMKMRITPVKKGKNNDDSREISDNNIDEETKLRKCWLPGAIS